MIKKILIGLLVIILLLVIGIVSLIVFVDPNNFRGFISQTVKDKTGYTLTIEGDLRWHIWPQISILSDAVRLEDEGAKKPILTADNMRLDVELFPLFSKELAVKNVLVKSAVINISDESKGKVAQGQSKPTTTVNQQQTEQPSSSNSASDSSWSFSLNKLEIADSTVIWQQSLQDIISFRDINISIYQKENQNVEVDLSGTVNRDQCDFIYSFNANVDLNQYPKNVAVALNKFNYKFSGIGLPDNGIEGSLSAKLDYQQTPLTVTGREIVATLDKNKIVGSLKATLEDKPYIEATFNSDKLDLTPFLATTDSKAVTSSDSSRSAPVVSSTTTKGNELAFLKDFDAKFSLNIKEIIANKLIVSHFQIDAVNKAGIANLSKVNLDIAKGKIQASGTANGKQAVTAINLQTKASEIDLGVLFNQLDITNYFAGQLNAQGSLNTNTIDANKLLTALNGDMKLSVKNARLENINIQRIIQIAVAQYSNDVITPDIQQQYTEVHEVSADAKLVNGQLNLNSLTATSETLDIKGKGYVNLAKQDMDINLDVQILSGWNGKSETITKLQKIVVPFRIYGDFNEPRYQLDIEKLIKDKLKGSIQQELNRWKDRLSSDASSNKDKATEAESEQENKGSDRLNRLFNRLTD